MVVKVKRMTADEFTEAIRNRQLGEQSKSILFDIYVEGLTQSESARKHGVTRQFASLLRKSFDEDKGRIHYPGLLSQEDFDRLLPYAGRFRLDELKMLRDIFVSGKSVQEVAKLYGCINVTLYNICKRFYLLYEKHK